jgi:hypothetical protein
MGKAPDTAQVIAQAKKNLSDTGPVKATVKQVNVKAKARVHDTNGGLVDQYKKMTGSAMW